MATTLFSDEPDAASTADHGFDPFLTSPSGPTHLRHSNFDTNLFALAPGSSAEQVKRAIQAHIQDTERRMEEAGKLGTALVHQQKQLTDKLREVEQLQSEAELNPELRQRLVDIEKDYNEVARDSARALLPKQRIPSNEAPASPFSPDKSVARRSVSPSKFETLAAPSPTKFSVPNRKSRNQPSNRIHDIEFAAEISTSLIAQVRNLQSLLQEREEEIKEVKAERSQLEIEAEGFQQRLKTLDESESRYKDENWNLETQIHEFIAGQKEAADREKKLTQTVNIIQAERNSTQRELEEVKDNLAKQDEKHSAEIKNLEIELGTSRRTAAVFETERSALQRKVDELTGQNQELAKAFSALQRGRALERDGPLGGSEEDSNSAPDHNTPEHSPPPSPMKPTPRHSGLESETLKTSLGHAQRTIQTLRTNIHREKTEKLELKRMLQDARDEIEKLRTEPNPGPKKSRKSDQRDNKKPSFKLNQLGVARASRTEVVDDEDWEDQSEAASPGLLSHRASTIRLSGHGAVPHESSSDQFETANETSDAAFETAHERGTETEDFQTGAEDLSDGAATETEAGPSRSTHSIKRPPPLPPHQSSYSFDSTASTSSEDDDYPVFSSEIRTPSAGPRMRMRMSRSSLTNSLPRRSRHFSEEPGFQDSQSSLTDTNASGTPGGQSLFAELNDLDNSDDDSFAGAASASPSRRSVRSATPGTPHSMARGRASPVPELPAMPKIMVDSGMMTEPMDFGSFLPTIVNGDEDYEELHRPMSMESVIIRSRQMPPSRDGESSRSLFSSYSDAGAQHSPFVGSSISSIQALHIEPHPDSDRALPPQPLGISSILSAHTEPVSEVVELPVLSMARHVFEHIEPVMEPEVPLPALSAPAILSQHIEPVSEPEAPLPAPPTLSIPPLFVSQETQPVAELEPPLPALPTLSIPLVLSQHIEPSAPAPVPLGFSAIHARDVEPVSEPEPAPPTPIALSSPAIVSQHVEPVELPEPEPEPEPVVEERSVPKVAAAVLPVPVPAPAPLSLSSIFSEHVEPRSDEPASPAKLSVSSIASENVEPRGDEPASPVKLSVSSIASQHVEPRHDPKPAPPSLNMSNVESWGIEPVDTPVVLSAPLSFSSIEAQNVEPVHVEEDAGANIAAVLSLAGIHSLHTEPVEPRSPKRNAFIIPRDAENGINGINGMIREKLQPPDITGLERQQSMGSLATPSTVRIHRPRQESFDSPNHPKGFTSDSGSDILEAPQPRRPGSSTSGMASIYEVPPLPSNHKEAIEAARSNSSHGGQGTIGSMGPPLFPASALKPQNQSLRPRTPTGSRRPTSPISVATGRATPTLRAGAARPGFTPGTADVHDTVSLSRATMRSRKSSISSFTSEVDTRFNMHPMGGFDTQGFGPNTDPRMIQAITQTMIGEYLWKYTRKTGGRGEMSEKRHRRYFWVHPYTRTLYWSDRDPSAAGRSELRAKSVPIEAVRVVADDNPMPPGLHRKSLIIVSPGRSVKFTCTTGQRHETWFNALSYLLLRTTDETHTDAEELAGNITREDVEEFNPSFGKRPVNGSRAPPSLSSYGSRTPKDSPTMDVSMSVPTLTPSRSKASQTRPSYGTLSRFSGYWKENKISGTFNSMRSRSAQGRHSALGIYETNDLQDSAEDLREMIERQDREADRLENVRACCDGKHDVGTLHSSAKKGGRHSVAGFRSPTPSATAAATPAGTVRSRA
ncbi:uncharacterized protein C8A04DRAFT_15948 [Dichotomopilus funicola]|uniref:PH domain-containing protein n=1 Tax=Dichotomopilus funicola TaxID=1934379 RepID=A0AAN6ZHG6_9PEZI|nr:hypothetical protein C8A04DRAFT_15948 [Dichotomopilus funicola]